jgi:ribosome-binding protein aMBF1 (putative translation factor)
MSNTLLPCPFCGGENICVDGYEHGAGLRWRIVCLDCMGMVDPGTIQQKYRAIEAWNRRVDARQLALKTRVCPMCEDCPDGCPVETPKDSRNIVTNADRIRGMSDEELATEITKNPSIPCRICEYYNHKLGHCDAQRDFVCVTAYAEALALDWLKQPLKEE